MVQKILLGSLLFLILISFLNCNNNTILFYFEDFWWEIIEDDGKLERDIKNFSRKYNCNLSMKISNEGSAQELRDYLDNKNTNIIVLGPLMASFAPDLAREYPDKLFALFGDNNEEDLPSNLLLIIFNRIEQYRKAGWYVGKVFKSLELWKIFNRHSERKVGILAEYISPEIKKEIDAFRTGIIERYENIAILEEGIQNKNDHGRIREQIIGMKNQGVRFFLLKTFELSTYCLDILEQEGCNAIIEDWTRIGGYNDVVFMSMEENYLSSLVMLLELIGHKDGKMYWKKSMLPGSVELHKGIFF